jgi:hypothetical protein
LLTTCLSRSIALLGGAGHTEVLCFLSSAHTGHQLTRSDGCRRVMYLMMVAGTDPQLSVLHAYQSPATVCVASACAFTIIKYTKQKAAYCCNLVVALFFKEGRLHE